MMRPILLLVVVMAGIPSLFAQNAAEPNVQVPACNHYGIAAADSVRLSQRFCMWVDRSVGTPEGFSGAVAAGLFAQVRERSTDRAKGIVGVGERVGTKYGQSAAKGMGELIGGFVNREDPRREFGPWRSQRGRSFGARLGHALAAPLWNYENAGHTGDDRNRRKRFAFSRVAGAFGSGFSGMAWSPDRLNTPGRALRRSASAYGSYFASALLVEFKADLTAIPRRLFKWM